jgi:hypothetical protein
MSMKRLFASLMLGAMLAVGGVVLVMPVDVQAQEDTDVVVGKKTINPYDKCKSSTSGIGEYGCQIGMFFIYGVWFRLSNATASLGAYLADHMLWFSLQSSVYRSELIATGWGIVRNFVNIGFILALLYAGWQFIFGKGSGSRILIRIILSALLVNFSLFGARLIIDMGNITARAIYSQIQVDGIDISEDGVSGKASDKVRISQGVLNISNPQRILFTQVADQDTDFVWKMFTMFFFAGVLNILLVVIFLSMAMLFITRTISLILLGILVPIPIVIDLIPPVKAAVQKLKTVGSILSFENWLSEYFKLSMMAPVYSFFLYLIIHVQNGYTNIAALQPESNGGLTGVVFVSLLPTVIIYFMIKFASSLTKDFSGAFGALITEGVSKAVGFVGGAALTAVTAGASLTGGALGKTVQSYGALSADERKTKLDEAQSRGRISGAIARLKYGKDDAEAAKRARLGTYMTEKATYDPRNIRTTGAFKTFSGSPIGKAVLGETSQYAIAGVNLGKASDKSFNDRDRDRSRKEEESIKQDTAAIHHAMEETNKRRGDELERKRSNPKIGEARRREVEKELERNNLGDGVRVTAADVAAKGDIVDAAKKELQSANKKYELAKEEGNPAAQKAAYKKVEEAKQVLAKAEADHQSTKFKHVNMSDKGIVALEEKVTAGELEVHDKTTKVVNSKKSLATEEEQAKKKRQEIDEADKKIQERRRELEKDRKAEKMRKQELEARGQFDVKQKQLHDERMAEYKADEDKINNDEGALNTKKKTQKTNDGDLQTRLNQAKADEEQLETIKKETELKKKAIEERKKKTTELETSLKERTYLDDHPEALAIAKTNEELKLKFTKAKTVEDKAKIMQEIGFHAEVVNEFKNTNEKNDAALMTLEKSLISQLNVDKKFMQHHIAEEAIARMTGTFGNIGEKIGNVIGTSVGVAVGTSIVGALTGGPLGAALAAGAVTAVGGALHAGVTSTLESPVMAKVRSIGLRDTTMQVAEDRIRSSLK